MNKYNAQGIFDIDVDFFCNRGKIARQINFYFIGYLC